MKYIKSYELWNDLFNDIQEFQLFEVEDMGVPYWVFCEYYKTSGDETKHGCAFCGDIESESEFELFCEKTNKDLSRVVS